MPWSKSPFAFGDVEAIFEKALNTPNGIKIECTSRGAAVSLCQRFNYWRMQLKEFNKKTYPEDHPMHGRSVYDGVRVRVPKKGEPEDNYLHMEPYASIEYNITEK